MNKIPVSVLILTKDEEINIKECIESVSWSDEIIVFDSYSSDNTCQIAESLGARIIKRKFDNWSSHQNWALENIEFRNEWVLYIDADERVSETLKNNIKDGLLEPGDNVAFKIERRDYFMNRWLKHTQLTSHYVRLFLPAKMKYERLVNPRSIVDGNIGLIPGHLFHYPFSKGISQWIDKHNSYSSLEAQEIMENRKINTRSSILKFFFNRNILERHFNKKEMYYKLPFRPLIMLFILYILKRGFLDGKAGFHYAVLRAFYEYMIVLKELEMKRQSN